MNHTSVSDEWIGHMYNYWEIIDNHIVRKYNGKAYFLCKCHCPFCENSDSPTTKYVSHYYLYTGKSKGCRRGSSGYRLMTSCNPSHKKKNKYVLLDDYGVGYIESAVHGTVEFLFDLDDYELINQYTWHLPGDKNHMYPRTIIRLSKSKCYQISLSRLIMGVDDSNIQVDHINHNTLDCRKKNLRICSPSENCLNKAQSFHLKHGVFLQDNKWMVRFRRNGVDYYGGVFDNYEDAVKKRIAMEPNSEFIYQPDLEEM